MYCLYKWRDVVVNLILTHFASDFLCIIFILKLRFIPKSVEHFAMITQALLHDYALRHILVIHGRFRQSSPNTTFEMLN